MSQGALTPSRLMPAIVDPIARRAQAAEQARRLRAAVAQAAVRSAIAWANANARVSVLEAEIAGMADRRPAPDPVP